MPKTFTKADLIAQYPSLNLKMSQTKAEMETAIKAAEKPAKTSTKTSAKTKEY